MYRLKVLKNQSASVSFGEYALSRLNSSVEKVGRDTACRDNHPGDDGISTATLDFQRVASNTRTIHTTHS